jgi:hypothetical protein
MVFSAFAWAESTPTSTCFGRIDSKTTIESLTRKCGKPTRDRLSGLYGPEWDLPDGTHLGVSSGGVDAPLIRATLRRTDGTLVVLYDNKDRHNNSRDSQEGQRIK